MSYRLLLATFALLSVSSAANAASRESLVRFYDADPASQSSFLKRNGGTLTVVSIPGNLYKWTSEQNMEMSWDSNVRYVQSNRMFSIFQSPSLQEHRKGLIAALKASPQWEPAAKDNPEIPEPGLQAAGDDPLLKTAWGIFTVGADKAWKKTAQGKEIVVAVTDTGVDYTHPDLINNMWRNKKEVAGDGKDNDENGYVDDIVGWDFPSNDNKPFDLSMSLLEILLQGGNPGHGTHVSGVVAARMNNSQGTAGVAPQAKIMALRFITEKGQGSTEDSIKAIDYAVANGANIINASWGGEAGDEDDSALKEAILRAEKAGVIFVVAAGNGRADATSGTSAGFDNDNDAKPIVPASYNYGNMVCVSATSDKDELAPFSNWGHKSCKLGAPGVKILSTVPGNKYQDTIIDLGGMKATWDGTSMAAPFVAGALAVVWSQSKAQSAAEVIDYLIDRVKAAPALKTKVSSEGRLELSAITE